MVSKSTPMARRIVVLDSHQFNDNRISKHISTVRERYDIFRMNVNFYKDRTTTGLDLQNVQIIDFVPTSKPYLNGALFTISTLFGGCARRAEISLKKTFIKNDDVIIFHVHDPYMLGLAKKLKKRFQRSRIVYDRHEYYDAWNYGIGFSIPHLFERQFGRQVDEIIFVSNNMEKMPEAFRNKKITVVPNYPLCSLFSKEVVTEKIGSFVLGEEVVIAYIGTLNLDFDRDTSLMFKIMDKLMRRDLKIKFVIAGRIYGDEIPKIIRAMQAEFGDRIVYLGEIPMPEVAKQAQQAHLGFLLIRPESPVWSDSRPLSANKVYEYLMGGTIPVIRAVIEDREKIEKCSLIFDEQSSLDDICNRMLALIGDRDRMKRMMGECYDAGQDFSWEKVSPRYLECYERVFSLLEQGNQ